MNASSLIVLLIALASAVSETAALAQLSASPTNSATETRVLPGRAYVLGPADQIAIRVSNVPEISDKGQQLDLNGDIRLPMIGRLRAAGMTVEELEGELTKRLKVYLQEPDVSVTVTGFQSQPVSLVGAVNTPGVQQLSGHKTLVEVLTIAGGLSADAGPTVRVTRRIEYGRLPLPEAKDDPTGQFSIAELEVKGLLEGRNPERNILVRPNDLVSVPRAELVYVVGAVERPGPLRLTGGHSISVLEAVSSSGGATRTAAPHRALILRRVDGDQKRAELNIDIKKVMQGKANDLALAAGDILVVPDSTGKRATTRALEALVQAGILIGTYGIAR